MLASLLAFSPHLPAQSLRISEFLSANDGLLQDEELESPDWIEIWNSGPGPVNLDGWHLTDTPEDLTRWTFPATNLAGGQYLVVFASGKNRAQPGAPLHTSFQLNNDGGYLALVQPDGVTIEDAFSPAYPNQRANVSYGLVYDFAPPTLLLGSNAAARWFVPADGSLGDTWTVIDFDDSTWGETNMPVGFALESAGSRLLGVDFSDRAANIDGTTAAGFVPFVIKGSSGIINAPTTRTFGDITMTLSNSGAYGYDDRLRSTPPNSGAFTESLLLRDFVFSRDNVGTSGLDLRIAGLWPNRSYGFTLWSFDTGSRNTRVSDWFANGLSVKTDLRWNGSIWPTSNQDYQFSFEAQSDGAGEVLISGRRSLDSDTFGVFINAVVVTALTTTPPTEGLASLMYSNNASAYLRIPFTVADPTAFDVLRLKVKYDDGFVAYLNGQPLVSRNAPETPRWDSSATAAQSDLAAREFEEILLANSAGVLVPGTNVLAIHGLNIDASDPDFSIQAELEGMDDAQYVHRYFTPPTPGVANDPGYLGLVKDTKFSVDRGFYEGPFTVAITSATANATIYWTTNGTIPSPTNGTPYSSPVHIHGTTLLRAAAFKAGHVPSVPDTHSYIFLSQVLRQPNNPPGYPTIWQDNYPADYGMDDNVVNHPVYGLTISNDLRAIPTLSLVTDHDALWHPSKGIYVDATKRGDAYEHPASVELFNGDNTSEFQVNCKLQMQGSASRDNRRLAKHSFRLQFTSDYGPSKLDYDWFGGPVQKFDQIVLRACFTDSWATRSNGNRYRPHDALYLRDVWAKETMRAMGHLSGRGDFVHLYVNGLYWGLYNPTERLDAAFFASHLGGHAADWDVMRDFNELLDGSREGWDALTDLVNAGVNSESDYQAVAAQVDIVNLIDYMILHAFAEAEDWPSHNWYAARRNANPVTGLPATKWIFLPWDQEIMFNQLGNWDRVNVSNNHTPARIYSQLRQWPEFRRLFGDRIHYHLFNGGALTTERNVARLQWLAGRIRQALVGESARWGDAREFTIGANPGHGQTFTRDEWWETELAELYTNWFPKVMPSRALDRWRSAGLYPRVEAPIFSQFGGAVSNGFALVVINPNASGQIYFTTDGSDPRQYGTGAIAPTAVPYFSAVPIISTTQVRARVFNAGAWSAIVEATFRPPQDLSRLVLTEIMYHPSVAGDPNGNESEFVEMQNVGTNTLNLAGLEFTEGIRFTFPLGTSLEPGDYLVLARNAGVFSGAHPGVPLVGVYTGKLSDGGEKLTLSQPGGTTVFSVTYNDRPPWPVTADGFGFSLVPKVPGASQASDDGADWRASTAAGGSPGRADPEATIPPVVINEVLTHTDPPLLDSIELYNPTSSEANIGGWYLTDEARDPWKYRIPDNTVLGPGGYMVFDERHFNTVPGAGRSFALNSMGEAVYLFSAAANGPLTGYDHGCVVGGAFNGVSFGRHLNSVGEESWPAQASRTLGLPNSGPRVGPVVINEIHYHPLAGNDEFVELFNLSGASVALFDTEYPTNTWRLSGVGMALPGGLVLGPGEMLVVAGSDPVDFRARYGVPAECVIVGPFPGVLQDSGERLELLAPDTPNTNGVPYVVIDAVRYNDKAPWPPAADGSGLSLQRLQALGYADDPANWYAAGITPGRPNTDADTDGDGMPDTWEVANGTNPFRPDADEDPDRDGLTNGEELLAGLDPRSAESTLKLDMAYEGPEGVILSFLAVSNRTYSVLRADTLVPGAWNEVAYVPAHATNRVERIVDDQMAKGAFYQLVTPARP